VRAALSIGTLLLLLTLALNMVAGNGERRTAGDARSASLASGLSLRVFSCGVGLHPARFRNRGHWQGILIDGRMYSHQETERGLRVAAIPPRASGRAVAFRSFDLSSSDADAAAFDRLVRTAAVDTVLAAGLRGSAMPAGPGAEERLRRLEPAFGLLGAQAPPIDVTLTSWCIVSVRRPRGWVPIAEKRSDFAGVALACSLIDDLSHYDDAPLPSVRADPVEASLYDALDDQADERVVRNEYFPVRRVELRSIEAFTPFGAEANTPRPVRRVVWPFVRIRHGTSFVVDLGHRTDPGHSCAGVRFEVRLDGELLAAREIPFEPNVWLPWRVELPGPARWAKLELSTSAVEPMPWAELHWGEPAVWGDPRLVYAAAGFAPTADGAVLDEDVFDLDHDGVITRANLQDALASLDADGDGALAAAEVPPAYQDDLAGIDANGDLRASADEVEAWIERMWAR
jgi:hypothetical protein